MKRLCGLILFWIGFGMAFMIIVPTNFFTVCLALICLIIGYNLFCGC